MLKKVKVQVQSIKYPKLFILLLTFVLAYVLFSERNVLPLHEILVSLSYLGTFIAGCFYAYGFTAAPAAALLLTIAKDQNIFIAGLVGGLGALLGDLVIFYFIRQTVKDELRKLSREQIVRFIREEEAALFGRFKKYVTATFAGFIIASPLPTEIGVSMMAALKGMSIKKFMVIAYLFHTTGIFIILYIGHLL